MRVMCVIGVCVLRIGLFCGYTQGSFIHRALLRMDVHRALFLLYTGLFCGYTQGPFAETHGALLWIYTGSFADIQSLRVMRVIHAYIAPLGDMRAYHTHALCVPPHACPRLRQKSSMCVGKRTRKSPMYFPQKSQCERRDA